MLRKIFLGALVFFGFICRTTAQSDSTSPAPTITGSVDAYFRYNFSDPKSGGTNDFTSFTNTQNSFQLGMASVRADHSWGKASATVDLGFGPRAEEFSYGDPDHPTLFAVKQAYVSYAVSDKFKLTIGKWATHIGYELTDAYLNRNYSMDYMFSYGPFSHTGLKADIGLGEKSALMLGVANTTDVVAEANSRRYALAQFSTGTSDDKFKAYVNYQGSYGGSYNSTQFDLVLTDAITDKFSLGYNGTIQTNKPDGFSSESWWGSALYITADPTTAFGITLRGEYFHNEKASATLAPYTNIFDVTLSPNFRVGNLTIIPELRVDAAKTAIFEKNNGDGTKTTVTGLLAATYHF
ncbi:MAG: outer membrane beta-barrel protein [Ginsengibacter sp.]